MSSRYSSAELSEIDSSEHAPLGRTSEEEARAAVFNVDLLIARLEEYKFGLEDANRRIQRSKSTSPLDAPPYNPHHKEATAVAAAARFRQEIERGGASISPPSAVKRMFFDLSGDGTRDGGSPAMQSENIPFSSQQTTSPPENFSFPFPSPTTTAPPEGFNFPFPSSPTAPPEPLETGKAVPYPTRSSSIARRPSSLAARRKKAQRLPPPIRANTTVQPQKEKEKDKKSTAKLPASGKVKSHQRSITVGDPRHSIASTVVVTPAALNFGFSIDKDTPSPALPRSPLLMGSPMEDQIRRELEALAIVDGGDLLEQSKRENGWHTPVVHVIELQEQEPDQEEGAGAGAVRERETHQQVWARTRTAAREPEKERLKATNRHAKIRRSNTHPQQIPAPLEAASMSVPATPGTEDFVWRPHQEGGMSRFGRLFMFRSFRRKQKTTAEDILDMYFSEEQIEEMKVPKEKDAGKERGGRWGFR